MSIKKARNLRNAFLILGVIIMLLSYFYEPLFTIGMLVTLSCLIPQFLFCKCPHCGKQLGRNEGKFCQHCGNRLDE